MNTARRPIPVLFLAKSHIDTYTRKDGALVQAHEDGRQAHPKGFKPGQHVMFPHPDKPGKKALGRFVGVRDGQSVVHHEKHGELKFDHGDVVHARGLPAPAERSLEQSKKAAEHVRQMQEKAKAEGGPREKFVKLDDRV